MKTYGRTDVGMLRHENQDAFGIFPLKDAVLAVLCDGMGGEAGGKAAAEICVSAFRDAYDGGEIPTADALCHTLSFANTAIQKEAKRQGYDRMGTTVVAALVTPEEMTLLWVGDSRAYLLRDGELLRLTRDHSYVQELIDCGTISEREARNHYHRNLLTRAVGAKRRVEADTLALPAKEGDRLLLCSDGLFGMVEEKEILDILTEAESLALVTHELICAANFRGGEDNVTVVLLENTKENSSDA